MRESNPRPAQGLNIPDQLAESWSLHTSEGLAKKSSRCQICDAHIHFSHVTDFHRNLTQETACCPECGIQLRRTLHRLQ